MAGVDRVAEILSSPPQAAASGGGRPPVALPAQLVAVYFRAAAVAFFGGAALYGAGLDLTTRQIGTGLLVIAPLALIPVVLVDVLALVRALRPLTAFLDEPDPAVRRDLGQAALVRGLNFPVLTAVRVLAVHVPAAAGAVSVAILLLNRYAALGVRADQIVLLWPLTFLVGCGHAILEYFMVSDVMRPVVRRIGLETGPLGAAARRSVVPVGTGRTLGMVAVFMVLVPLAVLGYALTVKVRHLLEAHGVPDVRASLSPLVVWIATLTAGCAGAVLFMAVRAGREVTRCSTEMEEAMQRVERDEFDAPLVATSASEFAGLYDGFNVMASRLRDLIEARVARASEVAALREKQHFLSLIENASDLITVLARDGTVRYESPSVRGMLGYEVEERVGRSALDAVHPEDAAGVRDALAGLLATRDGEQQLEFRCRHRNDAWVILEATGKALEEPGGEAVVVLNSRDVTHRRAVEAALRESEERVRKGEKMEALGRISAGVAHNFNNLLTVIMGQCDRALGKLSPGEPVRANLEQVRQAAARSAQLTKQILASGGKQLLRQERMDLQRALPQWADVLRPTLGERIELQFGAGHDPLTVEADPVQIEHVILNLALNARDAMPRGGRLRIEARRVACDERLRARHPEAAGVEYVRIDVADSGTGMDADTKAHLFEPFFTTKNLAERTGLGLASAHGIISQHAGFVDVESEPGRGTTFVIHLPFVSTETSPVPELEMPPLAPADRYRTVLLVEDTPEVLNLAGEILESHGLHVLAAHHPGEALLVAERHEGTIDLLLTDIVMPHMTGWELGQRMRELRPEMRVIYMSAYAHDEVSGGRTHDPHTPFLEKPFNFDTLIRAVRATLDEAA